MCVCVCVCVCVYIYINMCVFMYIYGSAAPDSSTSTVALVDEAVEVWSRMLEADHLVQANVLHEVKPLHPERSRPVSCPTLVPACPNVCTGHVLYVF